MSDEDREQWDDRYSESGMAPLGGFGPPPEFAAFVDELPASGPALELACGRGRGAAWLAGRGLDYFGVDVSPVAIDLARQFVAELGLSERCRFAVHDLDSGLPAGPRVAMLLCYKFRDQRLDEQIIDRLQAGGILAIAVLSEVDAGPGRFRAQPGELTEAFAPLETVAAGEEDGMAWLIGRKPAQ